MNRIIFVTTLLIGLAATAPISKDEKLTIDEEFFSDRFAIYTSQHDIVKIFVPLNQLNFEEETNTDAKDDDTTLFFVEAETDEAGNKIEKGLFILKNGVAKKLLDNGRDAAAGNEQNKEVYFGAKEGIFLYNAETNEAEKFGTITDSIISIVKVNSTDVLYIITEDNEVFKVTEKGTKKEKLNIDNAKQIVLDYSDNLYFYNKENEVYVKKNDKLTKIQGLPANPSELQLVNPLFIIEDGIPVVVDDLVYLVYANGTSEVTELKLKVKPSAYAPEGTLIQYYAHNNKIYEYNILMLLLSGLLEELRTYLNEQITAIQNLASRHRSEFGTMLM